MINRRLSVLEILGGKVDGIDDAVTQCCATRTFFGLRLQEVVDDHCVLLPDVRYFPRRQGGLEWLIASSTSSDRGTSLGFNFQTYSTSLGDKARVVFLFASTIFLFNPFKLFFKYRSRLAWLIGESCFLFQVLLALATTFLDDFLATPVWCWLCSDVSRACHFGRCN